MSADPTGEEQATEATASAVPAENEEKEGDQFRLRVSKDRMRVYFECDATGRDLDALAEAVLNRLLLFGVRKPPSLEMLRQWLREHTAVSPLISEAVILEGTQPVPAVDGRIEWAGDFFNPGFLVDKATGRINFRQRAGERNVKAAQLLATITPPIPGKNGLDVTGEIIRVRKPRSSRIRVGPNVHVNEATASYYAEKDGRFRWDKEFLAVDELYEIKGDLGLETGDISHQGAVLVHHDILEGARLEALGDVEVLGIVDGAHVQTGGILKVHGGITGRHGTRVVATGGVRAKYILDANILSGGDVVVEKEVMHSQIATRGALFVPQGRIVGGHAVALGGIDVGQAGSAASSPTELVAGEDYALEGRLAILRHKLHEREENVERVKKTIGSVRGRIASLPEASKNAIRTLLSNLPGMEASILALKEEIEDVRAQSQADARHIILVRNHLFPETRLGVLGEVYHAREEVAGPIRPVYVEGALRLSMTRMRSIGKSSPDEKESAESLVPEENETP